MICLNCNTDNKHKVIAYCLPMSLCTRCGAVSGFFKFFYLLLSLPERYFDEGIDETYFMGYEGSYWLALKEYIKDVLRGRIIEESERSDRARDGGREN